MYYECLWYDKQPNETDEQAMQYGDIITREFKTKKTGIILL